MAAAGGPVAGNDAVFSAPCSVPVTRYTEERLEARDVYILGWLDTKPGNDSSVSGELTTLLRQWKQDQPELLRRFDRDGDGNIDADEWRQARQIAHRQVLDEQATRPVLPPVNLVRAGGHDGYPFLISARPGWLLSDRYRRHAWLALVGLVGAVGALAWMLTLRF